MTQSDYQSDFILERLMRLHPKVIDLVLDRVHRLLAALDHPERALPPVVHIAGTNGKGSSLAFLRAMMEADAKRVHVYSSPHLVRFHERIRLAGDLIEEKTLQDLLNRCEQANQGAAITYFEITTCAAFKAFAEAPADYLLLETGLGGRLDATNVVERPALTMITPISHDHGQFLGDTIAKIAFEKAGIMKPGVACLSAEQPAEAADVLKQRAEDIGATLEFVPPRPMGELSLLGQHQHQNAALASRAAALLGLSQKAQEQGLKTAKWPGRFQRMEPSSWHEYVDSGTELWLDGGHNAAAGEAIASFASQAWQDQPLHVIYGMLNTKEAGDFIAPIATVADTLQAIEIPDQVSSLSAEQAANAHSKAKPNADLASALKSLKGKPGRVLICGSLYLAGWVLAQA